MLSKHAMQLNTSTCKGTKNFSAIMTFNLNWQPTLTMGIVSDWEGLTRIVYQKTIFKKFKAKGS